MRRLYLVRHAKSHWECDWLDDIERPLAERGKRDAPKMGKVLSEILSTPLNLLISSPAIRAYSTARLIAEEIGYDPADIRIEERLYEAMTRDMLSVIGEVDPAIESLMLFGHNPTMTSVANRLTNAGIDNVPTTGVVVVDFESSDWGSAVESVGRLVAFEYPKKYRV